MAVRSITKPIFEKGPVNQSKLAPSKSASQKVGRARAPKKSAAVKAGTTQKDVTQKDNPVSSLRKWMGLSQPLFARLLSTSVRTVATLERGQSPTDVAVRRLTELQRLINALSEVIKKESLGTWLVTPNTVFDGFKPLEVIERGESDRIWSMIFFLRSGVPS